MRVVTILRKPLEGTVAGNVLVHGCGGLNIDATRIGIEVGGLTSGGVCTGNSALPMNRLVEQKELRSRSPEHKDGRFPANLILQHLSSCEQTGTQTVPGYVINRFDDGAKPFGNGAGHAYTSEQKPDEQVAVWTCSEGCPVQNVDSQSGYLKTGKVASHSNKGMWGSGADVDYADQEEGEGASRFFKQVKP